MCLIGLVQVYRPDATWRLACFINQKGERNKEYQAVRSKNRKVDVCADKNLQGKILDIVTSMNINVDNMHKQWQINAQLDLLLHNLVLWSLIHKQIFWTTQQISFLHNFNWLHWSHGNIVYYHAIPKLIIPLKQIQFFRQCTF